MRIITGWGSPPEPDDKAYSSWPPEAMYPKAAMFEMSDGRTIAVCRARVMWDGVYYKCHLDNKVTESWFNENHFHNLTRLT